MIRMLGVTQLSALHPLILLLLQGSLKGAKQDDFRLFIKLARYWRTDGSEFIAWRLL